MRSTFRIALPLIAALLTLSLAACESDEDAKSTSREEAIAAANAEPEEAAPAAQADDGAPAEGAECRVDVAVTGMVCDVGCSPTVMSALEKVDGVARVQVDFSTKHASVDAAGKVCTEAGAGDLVEALKGVDFDGSVEKIEAI